VGPPALQIQVITAVDELSPLAQQELGNEMGPKMYVYWLTQALTFQLPELLVIR
jgi:hypothetical protein